MNYAIRSSLLLLILDNIVSTECQSHQKYRNTGYIQYLIYRVECAILRNITIRIKIHNRSEGFLKERMFHRISLSIHLPFGRHWQCYNVSNYLVLLEYYFHQEVRGYFLYLSLNILWTALSSSPDNNCLHWQIFDELICVSKYTYTLKS